MFNQVFLDVMESVNILVNSNGQIIRSDVVGALKMRTYLRLLAYDLITQYFKLFSCHKQCHQTVS